MATVSLGRPSATTTGLRASSVISSSRSTRPQASFTSQLTSYLSTDSGTASASPTSATTRRANAVSTNDFYSSQLINMTRHIDDTVVSYEVDATGIRAKGPSRVAIAVGVVLAILAVTGAFATLFLFLRTRRRRQMHLSDLHSSAPIGHGKVQLDPQREPRPVEIHVERDVYDWRGPGQRAAMANGVETGGSVDGHRSFRVPRKPPPRLSETRQVLSTPQLAGEKHSEGVASTLTLPSTPGLQKPVVDINGPNTEDCVSKVVELSIESPPNGCSHATNPIPIPGVHRERAESITSEYAADTRPVFRCVHSADYVGALATSTPAGPGRQLTTSPASSSSACFHEPLGAEFRSGLTIPTPGPAPHLANMSIGRFGRGVPARTISDAGVSQDVKIGFVSNNLPLVYYPGSHEGPISARGSIHSGMAHAMPGDITLRMKAQPLSYSNPILKKARSAEAISVWKLGREGGLETPQMAMSTRSRTPIRRPSRKEVPKRLIAELEKEIGGLNLDGSSVARSDNLFLDGSESTLSVPVTETRPLGPRPHSSSHSQPQTIMS